VSVIADDQCRTSRQSALHVNVVFGVCKEWSETKTWGSQMGLAEYRIEHGIDFVSLYPRLITENARRFRTSSYANAIAVETAKGTSPANIRRKS